MLFSSRKEKKKKTILEMWNVPLLRLKEGVDCAAAAQYIGGFTDFLNAPFLLLYLHINIKLNNMSCEAYRRLDKAT